MYKIGAIKGNPVIMESLRKNMGVKETVSYGEIISIIANSDEYTLVRDKHVVTSNIIRIITWQHMYMDRGFVYYIQLVREFVISYDPHIIRSTNISQTVDGKFSNEPPISINEFGSRTRFEVVFIGDTKKAVEFYDAYILPINGVNIDTQGHDKDSLEKDTQAFIDNLYQNEIPKFIIDIDKRITELQKLKSDFLRVFNI
jgi:hypothetical protein